jgi:hypothetical protein
MPRLHLQSSVEQTAAHLRADLASGRLRGLMPGVLRLEAELGVNRKTIDAALRQLQREGPAGGARGRAAAQDCGKRGKRGCKAVAGGFVVERAVGAPAGLPGGTAARTGGCGAYGIVHVHRQPGRAGHGRWAGGRAGASARRRMPGWWLAGSREVLEWFSRGSGCRPLPCSGVGAACRIAAAGPDKVSPSMRRCSTSSSGLGIAGWCCWRVRGVCCRSREPPSRLFSTRWRPTACRWATTTCRCGKRRPRASTRGSVRCSGSRRRRRCSSTRPRS